MREENDDAARILAEARTLIEQLHDPHDLGHVDQGLALVAVSQGDIEAGRALLDHVSRRFISLDKAAMGTAYALGMADVYRGAGRPAITAELLRHALTLLDKTTDREKYAQVREQLAAVDDALVEDAGPQP